MYLDKPIKGHTLMQAIARQEGKIRQGDHRPPEGILPVETLRLKNFADSIIIALGELEAKNPVSGKDLNQNVQIRVEVPREKTESQELLLREFSKMFGELTKKMEEDRVKAERKAWIRTLLGAILGFILGKTTSIIGL